MSNTVRHKTKLTNGPVIRKAVEAVGGEHLGIGVQKFYQGQAFGHRIRLPGFGGIIVIAEDGTMSFDGDYARSEKGKGSLDRLKQQYAVSAAEEVFEPQGYNVSTEKLENGSIKVVCTLGGGYDSAGAGGDTLGGGYGVG